jgi:hypothetical protein
VRDLQEQSLEATTYSLDECAPTSDDRRDDTRHLTLFRVGAMDVAGRRELCLIKNISAGGMKIRPYCELQSGDRLTIELKTGMSVPGHVSWINEHNAGVEFDEPVDVIDVLSAAHDGPRPRMPRIEVDCHANVRDGAHVHRMRVIDVSQGGVKLESAVMLPVNGDLTVTLPGLEPQSSATRWCDGGFIGVTFNRLLSLAELVEWLRALREQRHAA